MRRFLFLIPLLSCALASAQGTVTVKDTVMRTYAYSDPDPVARTDRVYPYTRYNHFALAGTDRVWKMVVLENAFLRVKIFPEIGGKIWSVYDKREGKELFYDNDVVKFREISLRGPWTSGGIEFNYGVIGHAPSCAHPVDYGTRTGEDGSVSCYIGVTEMLSGSRWVVEINLPADAVWVRTRSFWHNRSGEFQPYYTWANSGVKASEDMEIIYPASYTIGHDGQTSSYPSDGGKDLSQYRNQGFGMDKSFHPGGSHKGYFGAYWADEDYGVLHYALRDEKLGRKYFSWAQSPQGTIWKDLLTDGRPQYVELQSGRLFNQNDLSSVRTPYKQFLFTPYGSDEWNEYWLPFSGIGRVSDMTLDAVVSVDRENGRTLLGVYPLRDLAGTLEIRSADGESLLAEEVDLKAGIPFRAGYRLSSDPRTISVGGRKIYQAGSQATGRPHQINPAFGYDSAEGLAARASYFYGLREYRMAEEMADKALEADPALVEALNVKALLEMRRLDFSAAYALSDRVLAIDEYNPGANYNGGMSAWMLGKVYDAMDRLEIAALTTDLRSAAYTGLARLHFSLGDKELAADYARKSLIGNAYNVSAYELLYQVSPDEEHLEAVARLDPLCHFPDIERMLAGKMTAAELDATIREELKLQDYFEYAEFYFRLGLKEKALKLLDSVAEENIMTVLWKAYVSEDVLLVGEAEKMSPAWVFPSRALSAEALRWTVENGGGWKCRYLLSMLLDARLDRAGALALLDDEETECAEYYAFRATMTGSRADLERAYQLDPGQWRFLNNLARKYYDEGDYARATALSGSYYKKHPDNFHVGDTYIKSLIADGQYEKAEKELEKITILPFEGQSGSRVLYRNVKLALAARLADRGRDRAALEKVEQARLWPENLGVGRPYDDLTDERTEDWMAAVLSYRTGKKNEAEAYLGKLIAADPDHDWQGLFDQAVRKENGSWPKLAPLVQAGSVPVDKKKF